MVDVRLPERAVPRRSVRRVTSGRCLVRGEATRWGKGGISCRGGRGNEAVDVFDGTV